MRARTEFVKEGTRVFRSARHIPRGRGMSYGEAFGTLLEEGRIGPQAGWDVYDIQTDAGEVESAYGFDLVRVAKKHRSSHR